jgi:diguanylate cyclase with GGDEF domain
MRGSAGGARHLFGAGALMLGAAAWIAPAAARPATTTTSPRCCAASSPAYAATAAASRSSCFDLDRFKAYNDAHGHGAGNRLLQTFGHVVAREKRDADIAARFGGEEFALLLPGRGPEALVVAERVRRAIPDIPLGALYEAKRRGRGRAVVAEEVRADRLAG